MTRASGLLAKSAGDAAEAFWRWVFTRLTIDNCLINCVRDQIVPLPAYAE